MKIGKARGGKDRWSCSSNEDSVSAAEVSAAAIERNGRGLTIGQITFGTGTSLAFYDLDDGSWLMMGVEMWLAPEGDVIWHEGLDPLVDVAYDPSVPLVSPYQFDGGELSGSHLEDSGDNQLLLAFDVVSGQLEEASI